MLNHLDVLECLDYNPETGVFTWKSPKSNRVKVGDIAGALTKEGYIRIGVQGKRVLAHRLAWLFMEGVFPKGDLDHINRNRSDNRITNLREVTRQENLWNNIGKGYYYNKERSKFVAQIRNQEGHKTLGYFDTEVEARVCYLKAKEIRDV